MGASSNDTSTFVMSWITFWWDFKKDCQEHRAIFCHQTPFVLFYTQLAILVTFAQQCLFVGQFSVVHSWYLSPPPTPAVYFLIFSSRCPFCTENAMLAYFGHFWLFCVNLRTFWCTFNGLNNAVVSQKLTHTRCGVVKAGSQVSMTGMQLTRQEAQTSQSIWAFPVRFYCSE